MSAFSFSLRVVLCCAAVGAQGSVPRATHDAVRLRTETTAAQARIKSFRTVYESHSYDESFPAGSYVRRVVAAKEPHKFLFCTAHGHDALPWRDDPFQSRTYVSDHEWLTEKPINRCYWAEAWKRDASLPGSLRAEIFVNATGWFPMARRARLTDDGGPTMLRDLNENDDFSLVRSNLEAIDGRWCHVLEKPAKEALWIDVARDYTLMAREQYGDEGARQYRYELTGHCEVYPRVWAPTSIRMIFYNHRARQADERRRVLKENVITVMEVTINDVSDSEMEWRPQPGDLWMNHLNGPTQTYSGGIDHLDNLLHWAENYTDAGRRDNNSVAWHALGALIVVLTSEVLLRLGYTVRGWIKWGGLRMPRPRDNALGRPPHENAELIQPSPLRPPSPCSEVSSRGE